MKNVLIISHYYFDDRIIGSIRSRALSKYLPEHDWNPIIITTHGEINKVGGETYRQVEYLRYNSKFKELFHINNTSNYFENNSEGENPFFMVFINKFIKLWSEFFIYPDEAKPWIKPVRKELTDIISSTKIDLIFSTSLPVTSHLIASEISKTYNIPWVADFRDLWTQNHYFNHTKIRNLVEQRLEKKTIKNAAAITTVSAHLANQLFSMHKIKTYCIFTGYDEKLIRENDNILNDKFTITYTGYLYEGRRDPEPLFQAIAYLIKNDMVDRKKIELQFIGEQTAWLTKLIRKYDLSDVVMTYNVVSREEAMKSQRSAQVLLIITWDNPLERGVIPGKFFDYLAAKRPVIHLGNKNTELSKIIDESGIGMSADNADELIGIIRGFYNEYTETGNVVYKGDKSIIEQYSQEKMVSKFVNVFNSVIGNTNFLNDNK